MLNIINDLIAYIKTLPAYAIPLIDILLEDSESISVRVEPGSSNEMRDMTGARYGDFQFAIYAKSKNPKTASDQLNDYIKALDIPKLELTARSNIKCEPITQAHYVSKAENGDVIYTVSFHIEYYEGV